MNQSFQRWTSITCGVRRGFRKKLTHIPLQVITLFIVEVLIKPFIALIGRFGAVLHALPVISTGQAWDEGVSQRSAPGEDQGGENADFLRLRTTAIFHQQISGANIGVMINCMSKNILLWFEYESAGHTEGGTPGGDSSSPGARYEHRLHVVLLVAQGLPCAEGAPRFSDAI